MCNGIAMLNQRTAAAATFEPLLTASEAAELLRIHEKTALSFARQGKIPAIRVGAGWRFRASALDKWVREKLESPQQSRRKS